MLPPPPRSTLFPYTTLFRSIRISASSSAISTRRVGVAPCVAGLSVTEDRLSAAVVEQDDQVRFRSEEHTSELQSRPHLVCRLLLEKKKNKTHGRHTRINAMN